MGNNRGIESGLLGPSLFPGSRPSLNYGDGKRPVISQLPSNMRTKGQDFAIPLGNSEKNRNVIEVTADSHAPEGQYADRPLTARFDGEIPFFGIYLIGSNEILIGPATCSFSEESLRAVVRHEETHYLFSQLTEAEQRQIVSAVMKHPDELAAFYQVFRSNYSQETLSVEAGLGLKKTAQLAGKEKYVEACDLKHGDQVERVNVALVIEELLAYSNSHTQAQDALGKNELFQTITGLASAIVSMLDDDTRTLLKQKGFFTIDPTDIVSQLMQDTKYLALREEAHTLHSPDFISQ